jgi:hypothetical protein
MDSKLKQRVDLMVNNYQALKSGFKWETPLVKHFGALIHAVRNESVNLDGLLEIRDYIKAETSWTSYFRGTNEFVLANLLYFEEDYKSFFSNMQEVYEMMKDKGFYRSQYTPLAAYTIVKESTRDEWIYRLNRMSDFYNKMKENHYWLTSQDDYVFAAVLAVSDLNVSETMDNIELCYKYLNNEGFYRGNDLQTLSHVLAIGEEGVEEKCSKAVNLYEKLKEKGCRLYYSGLATIGLLALITDNTDKITDEVQQVYEYIYEQDGYSFWSLDKNMRAILAATLVSDIYVDDIKKGVYQVTLGNSINAIIIAQQQAAIAAAVAASTAAASASS